MKKSGKIFTWILITVIVILIIYVLFISKKQPVPKGNLFTDANSNTNQDVVIVIPPVAVSGQTFSVGDKIYAGDNIINTYTSCAPTSTNISNTYNKGDLIGTFLRKQDACIVIAVETRPFGVSWIPITGSEEVYLPLNALVYKG